jgi:hypothetical protein
VLLGVLASLLASPSRINADSAMYLQIGELLLHGQRPYVDFLDINPPMVMYLNVIPAALARISPFPTITTFNLLIWVLVAGTLAQTWWLIRRVPQAGAARVAGTLACGLAAGHVIALFGSNWGEREQIFMAAAAPYLALRFLRTHGVPVARWSSIAIGALAGVTACMKPHFVFILAAVEVALFPVCPPLCVAGAGNQTRVLRLGTSIGERPLQHGLPRADGRDSDQTRSL